MNGLDEQICKVLGKVIAEGRKNFIIYPFGVNGVHVKNLLNIRFGIQEKYIIDNNICKLNPHVHELSFLSTIPVEEYTLLLTNTNPDSYEDIRQSARKYVQENCIVDIFEEWRAPILFQAFRTECGKYSNGPLCHHWLVESVGAFSSFGPGCDVVLNHAMSYISTHGFLYAGREANSILPLPYEDMKDLEWYFPGVKPKHGIQKATRIKIGNDVWLGKNVIITNGATIGDGVIAGAGAVITKDVPDYAIVGGVPARLIRWRYTKEQALALKKIAWWDWTDEKIRACYDDFYLPIDEFIDKHQRCSDEI